MRTDLHLYNDTAYDRLMEHDINEPGYEWDPIRTHALFTDDDLGRDGHHHIPWPDVGKYPITHVAIPIDQYRRIFGEP